ncbi:uncharacterized protein A4U43_C04F8640 [Asparagus officinalis]|uniref:Uncharacterized protein n=1 Tax=Asparagus officinalis TaxID=4686 RepID=A0A5P1EZC6_ASPOF|nr:uncharacterized protein A4U43_C04F8640 [Asparagus officinalis]
MREERMRKEIMRKKEDRQGTGGSPGEERLSRFWWSLCRVADEPGDRRGGRRKKDEGGENEKGEGEEDEKGEGDEDEDRHPCLDSTIARDHSCLVPTGHTINGHRSDSVGAS